MQIGIRLTAVDPPCPALSIRRHKILDPVIRCVSSIQLETILSRAYQSGGDYITISLLIQRILFYFLFQIPVIWLFLLLKVVNFHILLFSRNPFFSIMFPTFSRNNRAFRPQSRKRPRVLQNAGTHFFNLEWATMADRLRSDPQKRKITYQKARVPFLFQSLMLQLLSNC